MIMQLFESDTEKQRGYLRVHVGMCMCLGGTYGNESLISGAFLSCPPLMSRTLSVSESKTQKVWLSCLVSELQGSDYLLLNQFFFFNMVNGSCNPSASLLVPQALHLLNQLLSPQFTSVMFYIVCSLCQTWHSWISPHQENCSLALKTSFK